MSKIEFFDLASYEWARKPRKDPTINITKDGRLNFNKAFVEKVLHDRRYAQIGMDITEHVMYIKLETENTTSNFFKIKPLNLTNTFYIYAMPFFRSDLFKNSEIPFESTLGTYRITQTEPDLISFNFDKDRFGAK